MRGLRELHVGLGSSDSVQMPSPVGTNASLPSRPETPFAPAAIDLLSALADRSLPLSKTLPQILKYAQVNQNKAIEEDARFFLRGSVDRSDKPNIDTFSDRDKISIIDVYVCLAGELNPHYAGWTSADSMMRHIQSSKDFKWFRLVTHWPVSTIEEKAESVKLDALCVTKMRAVDLVAEPKDPDREYSAYFAPTAWKAMLGSMRAYLIQQIEAIV